MVMVVLSFPPPKLRALAAPLGKGSWVVSPYLRNVACFFLPIGIIHPLPCLFQQVHGVLKNCVHWSTKCTNHTRDSTHCPGSTRVCRDYGCIIAHVPFAFVQSHGQ